jgi:hypothetical protein
MKDRKRPSPPERPGKNIREERRKTQMNQGGEEKKATKPAMRG